MHALTHLALLLALALVAAACGDEANASIALNAGDGGRTIALEPSQELVVTLDSNASTGFRWVLSTEPDPEILEVVDSTYTEPETELVGAPGQQVWTFRALAEGRTTLELSYERSSGETAGEPFDLTVEVG